MSEPLNEQPSALADELERLIEASQRATGLLENMQWLPSRAHFEGLRNTVNGAIRFLTALKTPDPQVAVLREALMFYADQWVQDVDAERTANGWEGSIGEIEPSQGLLNDKGDRARAALNETRHD